jgi:uncharacterized protein
MTQPDSLPGYLRLFEDVEAEFRNEFAARLALRIGLYRPLARASQVLCPLLVVTVAGDRVTPPGPARELAARAPLGTLVEHDAGAAHFEIYVGELFERTVAEQTRFLRASLGVADRTATLTG